MGVLFAEYFGPTIYIGSLLKNKQRKTMRTKEHSKQSSTNKIKFIYQQIHKKETLQNITNILILLNIPLYVYITNMNIMEKRLNIKSVL